MISVAEAKDLIQLHTPVLSIESVMLDDSLSRILAEEIYSPIDLPPFKQSSMDGYAFSYLKWDKESPLKVIGEIAAGATSYPILQSNEAVRIFTGARLPDSSDTVIMQEKVEKKDDRIYLMEENLNAGAHVRPKGFEILKGSKALQKHTIITPATIGFLASMGIKQVPVLKLPSIGLLITGNEIQSIGTPLEIGKVFDSNSHSILAAIKIAGINAVSIHHISDGINELTHAIQNALSVNDFVILTGGVSVGDYDLVVEACTNNQVETIFHKIKQKPGKPMYFGAKGEKLIFGLPGNPSSALTCFYEYVEPSLKKMIGKQSGVTVTHLPMATNYKKNAAITHFLKAMYNGKSVALLDAQESFRLKSFAVANSLIMIPEGITEIIAGEMVEVHILP